MTMGDVCGLFLTYFTEGLDKTKVDVTLVLSKVMFYKKQTSIVFSRLAGFFYFSTF